MSELGTFLRSQGVYSKTADTAIAADFDGDTYVFVAGMPFRYKSFIHYCIQAVNPSIKRPEGVDALMQEETDHLLGEAGITVEQGSGVEFVCKYLRQAFAVDGSSDEFRKRVDAVVDTVQAHAGRMEKVAPEAVDHYLGSV
jgi:hypothetical protein